MDTTQITNEIIVNVINWYMVFIMTAIPMLGVLIYNLWHARDYLPLIGVRKFNIKKLVVQNSVRALYCLIVSASLALTLNWIPNSADFIEGLSGSTLTYSAVGLLAFGFVLAKGVFELKSKKEQNT